MPTESPGLQSQFSRTQQSALITANAAANESSAAATAGQNERVGGIFPKETSASAKCCFFSVVTAPPASGQTSALPLIQTFDINKKVDSAMHEQGLSKATANQEALLHYARQATEAELPFVAKQLATLKVLMEAKDPGTLAKEIKLLDASGEFGSHASRLANYLESKDFDVQQGTFANDSGLSVGKPATFCPMPQDRHVLMRAMDIVSTNFAGRTVTGKPYAEYLVPDTLKGQGVFPPGPDQEILPQEQYAQLFGSQPNFTFYAHLAVQKDGIENLTSLVRSQPELAGAELNPAQFAKAKPHLVVTASPAESKDFVSQCTFPQGEWHITLPEKVLDQIQYSDKHDVEDPEKLQKFIFVQEMGTGNILLSVHLDTTFHHSTPLAGVPTATAGELDGYVYKDEDGKFKLKVDTYVNKSGHYHPSLESMAALRDILIQSGLDATKVNFKAITREPIVLNLLKEWNSGSEIPSRLPKFMGNAYTTTLNQASAQLRQIIGGPSLGSGALSKATFSAPALAASTARSHQAA